MLIIKVFENAQVKIFYIPVQYLGYINYLLLLQPYHTWLWATPIVTKADMDLHSSLWAASRHTGNIKLS